MLEEMPTLLSDSISYSCKLRSDARWDDGTPVTFDDVLFTFKAITCPLVNNPDQKSYLNNLKDIVQDANDPYRFTVLNKRRYFDNAGMLSLVWLLQKSVWDPKNLLGKFKVSDFQNPAFKASQYPQLEEFAASFNHQDNARVPSKLHGLGPYYVAEWQTGSSITLHRKENWWGKNSTRNFEQAWPDRIIFRIIRDMESVVLGIKKQEIDVSVDLSAAALEKLQKRNYFNENYYSEVVGSFTYTYLGLNMRPDAGRVPFFTDKRVRKALAHITPVEEIIQISTKGQGKRIASFGLPYQQDFNEELKPVAFDYKIAAQYLDEAGWIDTDGDNIRDKVINGVKVPFSFALSYMISPVTKEIAQIMRRSYYKAGIDARLDPMDFSVFYQKAAEHNFDAMLGSWSSGALPEDPRQTWHTENWANNGSNFVGFGNAYTDSLITQINLEINPEKRSRMMKDFQEIVAEEQPYVFLFNATRKIVIHRRFQNAGMYPERPNVIINNLKLDAAFSGQTMDRP